MSRITFTDVSHSYGDRQVLAGIDLELTERRVGIIGANGSGKSTLARMINGLVTPDRGRVSVDGLDVARQGRRVRRRVGFLFSDADSQIVLPTPAEDLAFSLRRSGLSPDEIEQRVAETLTGFDLDGHRDHPAHLLSSGQKQLLALAATLIREPEVLIADEPTTLLDARNSRRVATMLAGLEQQLIMVTHQLQLLSDFDRVLVVEQGRVLADADPATAIAAYHDLLDADSPSSGRGS